MKKIILIFVLLCLPVFALAEAPFITSVLLGGKSGNVVFNAINGKDWPLTIELTANQSVKFNTIAICPIAVACTRSTAAKYFTQTDPALSVSKSWDGKTGGSNPQIVSDGEYKISVTIALSESSNIISQELSQRITVSSSFSGDQVSEGNGSNQNSNPESSDGDISDNSSVHTGETGVSDYKKESFKIGAGRERLATVRTPILFSASQNKKGKDTNYFIWSFGDGTSAVGIKVYHTYQFPGRYNVVLNGLIDDEAEAVARTTVLVTESNIKITAIDLSVGYVEITNNSDKEQNLNNWNLRASEKTYVFPIDTIISPKVSIKIPLKIVGLIEQDIKEITLTYPDGEVASGASLQNGNDLSKIADLKKQLLIIKQQIAANYPDDGHRVRVLPMTVVGNVGEKKNVVVLPKEPNWFEKIKHAIFE